MPILAGTLAAILGCSGSDTRTEQIQPGLPRDSALAILNASTPGDSSKHPGPATPGDSLKNLWRTTRYMVNGTMIEILWYSPGNEHRTAADTVPKGRVIPVVLLDGKVAGIGRTVYDQVVSSYKLPKNKY